MEWYVALKLWSQAYVGKVICYNKDNLGNEFKFRQTIDKWVHEIQVEIHKERTEIGRKI